MLACSPVECCSTSCTRVVAGLSARKELKLTEAPPVVARRPKAESSSSSDSKGYVSHCKQATCSWLSFAFQFQPLLLQPHWTSRGEESVMEAEQVAVPATISRLNSEVSK